MPVRDGFHTNCQVRVMGNYSQPIVRDISDVVLLSIALGLIRGPSTRFGGDNGWGYGMVLFPAHHGGFHVDRISAIDATIQNISIVTKGWHMRYMDGVQCLRNIANHLQRYLKEKFPTTNVHIRNFQNLEFRIWYLSVHNGYLSLSYNIINNLNIFFCVVIFLELIQISNCILI